MTYQPQQIIRGETEIAKNPGRMVFSESMDVKALGDSGVSVSALVTSNVGIFTGRYYSTPTDSHLYRGDLPANKLMAIPIVLPAWQSMNRIGLQVYSAKSDANIRLGMYENVDGVPGNIIQDAGTVSAATTGNKEIIIDWTSTGAFVWLVCLLSSSVSLITLSDLNLNGIMGRQQVGVEQQNIAFWSITVEKVSHLRADYSYGALPQTFPTVDDFSKEAAPYIWLRIV